MSLGIVVAERYLKMDCIWNFLFCICKYMREYRYVCIDTVSKYMRICLSHY